MEKNRANSGNFNIVPVFKKGDKKCVRNYRPITILHTLNKIFEKLTLSRLVSFLTIPSENQFGFTKGKDTGQAALKLLSQILPPYLNKQFCACIFIDFSKAFDTVDHNLLLQKLKLE